MVVLSVDVGARQYKVNDRVPLDGDGGWDYLVVDPERPTLRVVLQWLMQSLQQYNTESRLTKFAKVFC